MFNSEVYTQRRQQLKQLVKGGIILLQGNNNQPNNYPNNAYFPFRQDSSFLYYFGLNRDGLVGLIDVDNDQEWLIGDDIDIEDIVWYGSVESVAHMAQAAGVANSAPMSKLAELVQAAKAAGRTVHFLPPYRHDNMIVLHDLLGIHPSKQREAASLELINAVVKMRSTKTALEIEELDKAAHIGYMMHTTAMKLSRPGVSELWVAGQINGVANSYGKQVSFATIFSQHGEIMHGNPSPALLEDGRLVLCDCGGESLSGYCSDNTRTFPVNGKFTQRQLDIYNIVLDAHDLALQIAKPGVKYFDVHLDVCRLITNRLKDLGLMKGDTEAAVQAGAHALFLPHGLGHMMGMDVHDMEGLGQIHVGFDAETRPRLDQFGTNALRMGRRLEPGFVVTDEPGIYFIPDLIDDWRKRGHNAEFLNFDKIEEYKDFGGIRLEDDILITEDGCRFLGSDEDRIPIRPDEIEAFMAKWR